MTRDKSKDFTHGKNIHIMIGNCIESMEKIPNNSIHCCITSPPYWGLRDYGTAKWEGGDEKCEHKEAKEKSRYDYDLSKARTGTHKGAKEGTDQAKWKDICPTCGAKKVDNQLGLEKTPEEYVNNLVEVFREVKRVLRDDGTLWLNLGDSYWGGKGASGQGSPEYQDSRTNTLNKGHHHVGGPKKTRPADGKHHTIKPKDLVGIPWRVAFALQADGWYLRQDIIWAKPNCMPESVKDRCTKNHEYIFLLTKSPKYFYDNEAIKEPVSSDSLKRAQYGWDCDRPSTKNASMNGSGIHTKKMGNRFVNISGKNKRSVWTVSPKPFKDAHFAVFPPDLIEPCVLAGTSAKGCCSECSAPYKRQTGRPCPQCSHLIPTQFKECSACGFRNTNWEEERKNNSQTRSGENNTIGSLTARKTKITSKTIDGGWQPTCECNANIIPCTILDPFGGSGTTAAVALKHNRKAILCELNEDYGRIMPKRIESISGLAKTQETLF